MLLFKPETLLATPLSLLRHALNTTSRRRDLILHLLATSFCSFLSPTTQVPLQTFTSKPPARTAPSSSLQVHPLRLLRGTRSSKKSSTRSSLIPSQPSWRLSGLMEPQSLVFSTRILEAPLRPSLPTFSTIPMPTQSSLRTLLISPFLPKVSSLFASFPAHPQSRP